MARFENSIGFILENEGGFQANPYDSGNYDAAGNLIGTNFGISAKVARNAGYTGSMEEMPRNVAEEIYRREYWPGLDQIENQTVATKILDLRVNFGRAGGDRIAQAAANLFEGVNVAEDGQIGSRSLAAINSIDPAEYLAALIETASERYRSIASGDETKEQFLEGWLRRAAKIPGLIADNPGISAGVIVALVLGVVLASRRK